MPEPIRVLFVDDEADFLEPVVFWLQLKGYQVLTAHNGQEAIEAVKRDAPDIAFFDINMPQMNGLEALRRLREAKYEIPIIMLTGRYQDGKAFTEANKWGIAGFFPKQSSLPELVILIETTLKNHATLKAQHRPNASL